jgi:hypothetical protein
MSTIGSIENAMGMPWPQPRTLVHKMADWSSFCCLELTRLQILCPWQHQNAICRSVWLDSGNRMVRQLIYGAKVKVWLIFPSALSIQIKDTLWRNAVLRTKHRYGWVYFPKRSCWATNTAHIAAMYQSLPNFRVNILARHLCNRLMKNTRNPGEFFCFKSPCQLGNTKLLK